MASLLDTMATALSDESAVGGIAARLKARKPVVVRPAAIESASSSDADDDDDEDFHTAPKRLPKTRCSNHASTVVQVAPVGSKRLDGSEARRRLLSGGSGQRTLTTKAAWRPSHLMQDLLPAGTGCVAMVPERRFFPAGVKGNELHERAMNEVVDKELGCSIQVSHVSVVQQATELSCMFAFVPQNGEYIKKMNYMGQHNDWLERNGWAQFSNRIAIYCADLCASGKKGQSRGQEAVFDDAV